MRAEDVAYFLQHNPGFFEDYAELAAQIVIPHPHGGRAISITERQILSLREKCRALESKLSELIRFGEENDAISERVHRLALALLGCGDTEGVLHVLSFHLQEDFSVPHVAARVWGLDATPAAPAGDPVAEDVRLGVAAMRHAYCGQDVSPEVAAWFGAGVHVRSIALAPLRHAGETVGVLALGSEEPERFYTDMGTVFLDRIGELAAAALVRTLIV